MHRYSDLPATEVERLLALRQHKIQESAYETLCNSITQSINEICNTPIALISLLEEDRQWFKSKVGIDGKSEIPIELAFCAHTILSNEVMEVVDATLDDRFKHNPLVIGAPHIRFFAGAPIALPLGDKIGSLCVMDTKPNQLNEYQKSALNGFAKVISQILLIRDTHLRTSLAASNE
jgi:GAF domain-containing protein